MSFPLITAHSGSMNYPDNSMQSIMFALQSEVDIVEEDVRATKDGEAVLFHDDQIVDITGKNWLISQLTYEELSNLKVLPNHRSPENGMRILRLEELLKSAKGSEKKLNLDIKDYASLKRMAELVHREGMIDQVLLTGCESEKAGYVHQHYPEFNLLLNADIEPFKMMSYSNAVYHTCENAKVSGCKGININYKLCTVELVERAIEYGLPIYVWTVPSKEDMLEMAEMGVKSITTRNVVELIHLKQTYKNDGGRT